MYCSYWCFSLCIIFFVFFVCLQDFLFILAYNVLAMVYLLLSLLDPYLLSTKLRNFSVTIFSNILSFLFSSSEIHFSILDCFILCYKYLMVLIFVNLFIFVILEVITSLIYFHVYSFLFSDIQSIFEPILLFNMYYCRFQSLNYHLVIYFKVPVLLLSLSIHSLIPNVLPLVEYFFL